MPKKLILHIGCPKTGTTSIQGYCVTNQDQLAANGILYPYFEHKWPGIALRRNGHGLYTIAMRKGGYNVDYSNPEIEGAYIKDLAAAVEPADTVLLSDETLWQMLCRRKRSLPALKETLDELGFTEYNVIVYLRRQDLYAESLWNQNVKGKAAYQKSFEEFAYGSYCKYALDYKRGLTRLEETFGKQSLTVRIYDRAQLKDGDSAADLMDAVGIEDLSAFEPLEAEFNDSIKGLSFLALKAAAAKSPSYAEGNKDFLRETIAQLSQSIPDENPGPIMGPQQREEYLERFVEGNRSIAREYFDRDELFGPQKVDGQQAWAPAQDELTRDAFLVLVEALCDQRKREEASKQHVAALENRLFKLQERVDYLERVNRNSLGLKVERALRGSKMKR